MWAQGGVDPPVPGSGWDLLKYSTNTVVEIQLKCKYSCNITTVVIQIQLLYKYGFSTNTVVIQIHLLYKYSCNTNTIVKYTFVCSVQYAVCRVGKWVGNGDLDAAAPPPGRSSVQ